MSAQDITALFGITKPLSSAELPQSVLDAAPHLAKLLKTSGDAHIDKTWELQNLYTLESVTKIMLNLMQKCHLEEPIPRCCCIFKLIFYSVENNIYIKPPKYLAR